MSRVPAPFGVRPAPVVRREGYGPYVVLSVEDPAGPRPAAGQFYMLRAGRWGGGEDERPFLPRAFSVLRAPAEGSELQFLIYDVGPGTRRLSELRPGEPMMLLGPLGRGFEPPAPGRGALLVGGGVGIAPLAIWADRLKGPLAGILLGFRDAAHAAGARLIPGAEVATDDGSKGHHGFVTELLAARLAAEREVEVYACGPPPMLETVRRLCAREEIASQLALESGMACGFGACFGCGVATREGYVRLCVDGPVLRGEALEEIPA